MKGKNRHNYIQNEIQTRNRWFSRDRDTSYRDRGRFSHTNIEGDLKTILGMTIEEITIENKGMEIEVETIIEILIEIVLGMTLQETEILGHAGVE